MKEIRQLIREIIPVIIGILIALLINNWNENRKDKKYLNQIFSSIEKELEESNADIKRALPKQQALLDSIDIHLNNDTMSLFDLALISNGLQKPDIKINSWKAIANSKIELIEYEKLSDLSDIEERKENLYERVEKTSDFLLVNITATTKEKKELLKMMTIDLMNAEVRLQSLIEEVIEK